MFTGEPIGPLGGCRFRLTKVGLKCQKLFTLMIERPRLTQAQREELVIESGAPRDRSTRDLYLPPRDNELHKLLQLGVECTVRIC
jgi:hypothetical protein